MTSIVLDMVQVADYDNEMTGDWFRRYQQEAYWESFSLSDIWVGLLDSIGSVWDHFVEIISVP